MIGWRSLGSHLAVLGVAVALSLYVWTRKEPSPSQKAEVQVWGGSPDQIEKITFDAENRSVRLEKRKDKEGLWFIGTVDKTIEVPAPSPRGDAGAGDAGAVASLPPPEKKKEESSFVSVEQGKKLAESLAPLMALRSIGPVDESRAAEFGFDKPDGTLHITIAGKDHELVLGGSTPGGGDRYAKDGAGNAYAVPGSIAQNLLFAESRLVERNLHGFDAEELKAVKIEKGTLSRELVRLEEKRDGWADSGTPTVLDETAGNWMSKLERLRIMSFGDQPKEPMPPDAAVVRVDYLGKGGRKLGYLELYKVPGEGKGKYLARTEHTRWYADVLTSVAEQVEQDLGSVVKAP
jgi:hypothetical protein